eukprot:1934219-Pyramimonas_sp.AAC.1
MTYPPTHTTAKPLQSQSATMDARDVPIAVVYRCFRCFRILKLPHKKRWQRDVSEHQREGDPGRGGCVVNRARGPALDSWEDRPPAA